MDFKSIIQNNAGRDIYICMEYPDGARQEHVLRKYRLHKYRNKSDFYRISSKSDPENGVNIFIYPLLVTLQTGIIMNTITAVHNNTIYSIYITDDIVIERILSGF